jgi:hypothetical protein
MRAHLLGRFSLAALCGVIVTAGLFVHVDAQTKTPERYNATAINMGSGPGMAGRVLLSVDRWTTPKERENLLRVFAEKGPDKLLDALQDMPKVGYIRLPNTLAWDLHYAFETPLPEGGRRVVLVTDRPIGFEEARTQPRRIDYPFTLLEIRFNKEGVGQGKMSVYTKITLSKDKQTMELENYGIEPVRLTEVRIEK